MHNLVSVYVCVPVCVYVYTTVYLCEQGVESSGPLV